MHFVYKTDNLFQSIRISYGNSSITKGFHILKLIWTPDFLCVQNAPFKATSSFLNPFWLHLLFFMHLLIILSYKTLMEKHFKWTLKRLKVGMVSSFHPHSMCKRVERVTAKTGRTSCTNWTISFEVSGFLTRTHLLHWHFIFLNLLQLQTCLRSVHTIQSDVINFQNFLTSFAIFQSFTDLFRELNDREIENHYKRNSENVETWYGIIISPT